MFTGEAASVSRPPALAANASGMPICEVGIPTRSAATIATGTSAAVAPMKPTALANSAQASITKTSRRVRLAPAFATRSCPAQVVTPAASRPAPTTSSDATKITTGSPRPASAASASSTPVKKSASEVATATSATGSRFQTNSATAAARMVKVIAMSLTIRADDSGRADGVGARPPG